jgi:hypothetical protein
VLLVKKRELNLMIKPGKTGQAKNAAVLASAATSAPWVVEDIHTGLVRFGFRDYDSQIGRWTAKDPIGSAREISGVDDLNNRFKKGDEPTIWPTFS